MARYSLVVTCYLQDSYYFINIHVHHVHDVLLSTLVEFEFCPCVLVRVPIYRASRFLLVQRV